MDTIWWLRLGFFLGGFVAFWYGILRYRWGLSTVRYGYGDVKIIHAVGRLEGRRARLLGWWSVVFGLAHLIVAFALWCLTVVSFLRPELVRRWFLE